MGYLDPEYRKLKTERNLKNALFVLDAHKIPYKTSDDVHFVVRGEIDYWPTTGKFIVRKTKKQGRGIFALAKALGVKVDGSLPLYIDEQTEELKRRDE